jgi:uncharacterized membrane protein YfcA
MWYHVFVSLVLFLASFVFGTAGFGFALVSVPLLALVVSPKLAVPFVLVYSYGINFFLLLRFKSHIQWPKVWPLMLGAAPGVPIGIYFLKHSENILVRQGVGVVVVVFVLWSLLAKQKKGFTLSRFWGSVAGFASGILGGAFAMPGPPLLIYLALNRWEKNLTRATIQIFFFFTGTCMLLGQAIANVLTLHVLRLNLFYLPVVILGGVVGYLTFKRLSAQLFDRIFMYLLLAIGILLIFSS